MVLIRSQLLIASLNEGKHREFGKILGGAFECIGPKAFPGVEPPKVVEDGKDYHENATKKAVAFFETYRVPVLSDDSGLEATLLDGEPGLYSARYGGENLSWPERWTYLIEELKAKSPQGPWEAQFRAVLCYVTTPKKAHYFEGICKGFIVAEPKGGKGFGYDPIFYSPTLGKTFGEASPEEKERESHRARAAEAFLASSKA